MPKAALIGGPGIETVRRLAHRALPFGIGYRRCDRNSYRLGDLVLHRENVSEIAVIALSPDMLAGFGLDQLRGDADAVAGFAQAAFEHVAHTQFAPDLLHIDGA